jgi:hypothetical protein
MTVDPMLIGIGAIILALILLFYMPVSKRKVNQNAVNIVLAVLIFVAAFAFLEIQLAIPVGIAVTVTVVVARIILGGLRSAIYTNFTRYMRRDYWQRRVGQSLIGSNRRRRRDDY